MAIFFREGEGSIIRAQAAAAPSGGWTFEFTPYIWGAGMSGEVEAGSLPKINVDMSFSDILKNLDAGLMGAFEARQGLSLIHI